MHFVLSPISYIFASFAIEESSESVSFPVKFSPFILASSIFLTNLH